MVRVIWLVEKFRNVDCFYRRLVEISAKIEILQLGVKFSFYEFLVFFDLTIVFLGCLQFYF